MDAATHKDNLHFELSVLQLHFLITAQGVQLFRLIKPIRSGKVSFERARKFHISCLIAASLIALLAMSLAIKLLPHEEFLLQEVRA